MAASVCKVQLALVCGRLVQVGGSIPVLQRFQRPEEPSEETAEHDTPRMSKVSSRMHRAELARDGVFFCYFIKILLFACEIDR